MKFVALNDLHVSLGAKMIEFAGYNMPVLYNNLIRSIWLCATQLACSM
jgi:aminomethyltransferase